MPEDWLYPDTKEAIPRRNYGEIDGTTYTL